MVPGFHCLHTNKGHRATSINLITTVLSPCFDSLLDHMKTQSSMAQDTRTPEHRYAILGGTGQTGRALIDHLLTQPEVLLNIYARSYDRLHSQNPNLSSKPNVTLFTSDLTDTPKITSCIRGASVVFSVLATNLNEPGTSIAQRTAKAICSSLEMLRDDHRGDTAWRCPTIILLSSASISPTVSAKSPKLATYIASKAFKHIYADLIAASEYYRTQYPWIPVIEAMPGGLVYSLPEDPQGEVHLSEDGVSEVITYAELARGMCKIADDVLAGEREKWKGKGVGIVVTPENEAVKRRILGNLWGYLLPGLVYTTLPWVYGWTH